MRLIDADALKDAIMQEVYKDRVGVFVARRIFKLIDNAPTVEYPFYAEAYQTGYEEGQNERPTVEPEVYMNGKDYNLYLEGYKQGKKDFERPQGEWVRKEDVIHYIAAQYSEHNELVPVWLSIGDLKGGAEC